MKKYKIAFLLAILMVGFLAENRALAQPGISVSFQAFYNELSPYGRWSSHPQYGSIWRPYVDRDFQPYATNGQWMMTEYGNTWVSDYDWGWAPFHYGRWFYDDFYGWSWVPDYEWGPAWVDWRTGGGYYGWAPLWPGIRVGVSFNIPLDFWVFVPQRYISSPRVFGYCLPRTRVVNVFHQTTIINNYYRNDNRVYAYGPRHSEIERVTRSNVPVYRSEEIRGSRYASARQNSNGTYQANGNSDSRLYRQERDENTSSNRRIGTPEGVGSSNRTYDTGASSRGRSSYDANSRASQGNRSYESDAPSNSRNYESTEPSSRARSSARSNENSSRYSTPESPISTERPAMRSRSIESPGSSPRTRSGYESSMPRSSSQAPARSSRSMESSSSAPRSSGTTNSTEHSSPSRSRGPR